jgi:TRAP-type C4-dicarboxylate transport system permease small subunit
MIQRIRSGLDFLLSWTLVIVFTVSVLNVLWQVFTRFVLLDPSSWTEELARYLLIWLALLGAAYSAGRRKHLAMEFLYLKVGPRGQRRLDIFIDCVVALFAVSILIIGGNHLVTVTWKLGQVSPSLQVPLAWVYSVIPLSGVLILFYSIIGLIETMGGDR